LDSIGYYDKYASLYYESTVELDMSEILRKFTEYLPEDADILDLGCGSGRDSVYFEEQGYSVTPLDGSKEMCQLAEIYTGKEVLNMTFDELNFDGVFDGVWACASLVHVEESRIDEVLEKVVASLKPGGILYMSFQYGDFSGYRNQRYFVDYTKTSLRDLLKKHEKLEIINIWKTDDVRESKSEQKWVNALARKVSETENEE
jgi:SAM-dependent methyltransferase